MSSVKVFDFEQNTPEWHKVRAGVPTASAFDKVIKLDGKRSEQYSKYRNKLIGEAITQTTENNLSTYWTERGHELEPEARNFFAFFTGKEVKQVGFVLRTYPLCGCSPDGLIVGKEEGLEIKCLSLQEHITALKADRIPGKYVRQVQGSMYVTGFGCWHFMCYYPGLKPLIKTVYYDDNLLSSLEDQLKLLNLDVDKGVKEFS